jgi:hypothetical protein
METFPLELLPLELAVQVLGRVDVCDLDAAAPQSRRLCAAVTLVWQEHARELELNADSSDSIEGYLTLRRRVVRHLSMELPLERAILWLPKKAGEAHFPLVTRIRISFDPRLNQLLVQWRVGELCQPIPNPLTLTYLADNYLRTNEKAPIWTGWQRHRPEVIHATIGLLTLGLAVWTVIHFKNRYESKLAAHHHALATVEPEVLENWQAACSYEQSLRRLKHQFTELNTEYVPRHHYYNGEFRVHYVRVPCNRVSSTQFWTNLRADTARWQSLTAVWDRAGYIAEEAFAHLFLSRIPLAGPSPIPPAPSVVLNTLGCLICASVPGSIAAASLREILHPPEHRDIARFRDTSAGYLLPA